MNLIGPFKQLLPMTGIPLRGPVSDADLPLIKDAGILTDKGRILRIGKYTDLLSESEAKEVTITKLDAPYVCLPGFIDSHTHICFGGSRARDYAMRNAGRSYLDIAKAGGGIWDTVTQTRNATKGTLIDGIKERASRHLTHGVTTIEVKSGYGLTVEEELKMLNAIREADNHSAPDLIATCLAAHMLPKDYTSNAADYLHEISSVLLPQIKELGLSNRVDAFIEESAFSKKEIAPYFTAARKLGFDITVHADQFTVGGSEVAVAFDAVSADHLEASTAKEIELLAKSKVIATALPGASLGLGCNFTPARRILDAGGALAIASDWNPGSAPMGHLLLQATLLGTNEKLTNAEVLAGITTRAAAALRLADRGQLQIGKLADFSAYATDNYQEILYQQGMLTPAIVWKKGALVVNKPQI